jgi:hypothetical protein
MKLYIQIIAGSKKWNIALSLPVTEEEFMQKAREKGTLAFGDTKIEFYEENGVIKGREIQKEDK